MTPSSRFACNLMMVFAFHVVQLSDASEASSQHAEIPLKASSFHLADWFHPAKKLGSNIQKVRPSRSFSNSDMHLVIHAVAQYVERFLGVEVMASPPL